MSIIPDADLGHTNVSLYTSDLSERGRARHRFLEGFKWKRNPTFCKTLSGFSCFLANRIKTNSRQQNPKRLMRFGFTWTFGFDDGFGWNAHATFIERQLAAGQAVGPAVIVTDHHGLAAWLGPLAHGLAGFNGLMLKVNCADWSIHGAEEEEQIWTAAGAWTSRGKGC